MIAKTLLIAAAFAGCAAAAVIVRPVANMYSSSSEDADVVSQAILGTNVAVVEAKEGWSKIRTPDDYTGWTPTSSLRETEKPYASGARSAQVRALFAHLYREASVTKHAPLLTAPFESRLEVVAEPETNQRRWIQVRLPDDRAAWVQRGDVEFEPAVLTIAQAIELSRRFLGLPYTWGGTSSYGYDCSGFTQMLCRRRGIGIPRDAQPQAHWSGMIEVEKDGLQAGDLVYFGSSLQKITHTGMYIGGGEFIHATTHDRPIVQISRLADEYWTKLFVAARRPK